MSKSNVQLALVMLLATLSAGASCGEEPVGACVTHDYSGSTALHYCFEGREQFLCEGTSTHVEEFYEDASCAAAGYPYYCTTADFQEHGLDGTSRYVASPDCDPRSTGGGTGSCGADGYEGPEFDPQADSFCKAAYAHECDGNQEGVDANCAIYEQIEADNPGIPSCPYCN